LAKSEVYILLHYILFGVKINIIKAKYDCKLLAYANSAKCHLVSRVRGFGLQTCGGLGFGISLRTKDLGLGLVLDGLTNASVSETRVASWYRSRTVRARAQPWVDGDVFVFPRAGRAPIWMKINRQVYSTQLQIPDTFHIDWPTFGRMVGGKPVLTYNRGQSFPWGTVWTSIIRLTTTHLYRWIHLLRSRPRSCI